MSEAQARDRIKPASDQDQWLALSRHRWVRVLLILCVLALLAVLIGGGFRRAATVPGKRHPVAVAGERIDTGAFAITPLRAWSADAAPGGYPKPGKRYLVLQVQAENLIDDAYAAAPLLLQDVVWLPDGRSNERKLEQPMRRADDHVLGVELQPGLPVRIDLVWEFADNEPLRQPGIWGVYARSYVERGYLRGEGGAGWVQGDPAHKIELAMGSPPSTEPR